MLKMSPRRRVICGASASLGFLAMLDASAAFAQSASDAAQEPSGSAAIEEIIVTAQKRSEPLQKVPLAVSAFSGELLSDRHIADIQGLVRSIPNVNFGNYHGNGQIAIRGLGYDSFNPGGEGRVALHLDGVYLSRPAAGVNAFFDVERVEVLRGPQGTLYGRNATAGSINIITRDPEESVSGYLKQTFGNYNDFVSEGAIGGGVAPGLSLRISGRAQKRNGFGHNIFTGSDIDDANTHSLRGKMKYEPTTDFSLVLSADYHHENDRNNVLHFQGLGRPDLPVFGPLALGGVVPARARDIASQQDPYSHRTYWGIGASMSWVLNDELMLKSITAYRNNFFHLEQDSITVGRPGGAPTAYGPRVDFGLVNQFEKSRAISQELQLSYESEKLRGLGGLYFFREKGSLASHFPFTSDLFGIPGPPQFLTAYYAGGSFKTTAAAIFGQFTYQFTPQLSLTVGERIGWERKRKDDEVQFDLSRLYVPGGIIMPYAAAVDSVSDYYHSPKVSLEYQATPNALLYASYSQGYKSGGFDIGSVTPAYKPEKLTDYEIGLKSDWFNRHLRINLAAFYYDYTNIQLTVIRGTFLAVENASKAKLYGAEAEITIVPARGLELGLTGGYVHSEYQGYRTINSYRPELGLLDLTGNQLAQTPKFNSHASLQYGWAAMGDATASLRLDWMYKTRVYFQAFDDPLSSAAANHKIDATLAIKNDKAGWNVSLYGRNLTNKRVTNYSTVNSDFTGWVLIGGYDPPRQYGVTLGYDF